MYRTLESKVAGRKTPNLTDLTLPKCCLVLSGNNLLLRSMPIRFVGSKTSVSGAWQKALYLPEVHLTDAFVSL